jgi:hypothetical protein
MLSSESDGLKIKIPHMCMLFKFLYKDFEFFDATYRLLLLTSSIRKGGYSFGTNSSSEPGRTIPFSSRTSTMKCGLLSASSTLSILTCPKFKILPSARIMKIDAFDP